MEIITNITYIDGPEVQVWFDEDEKDKKISVEFWDTDAVKILYTHEDISESGGWCSPDAKYFVNWKIKIFYGDDLIKVEDFDLKDKKVIIVNGSSCLGDSLAWIPYIEEFRKKYKCDVTYSTIHKQLFSNQYKKIKFVTYTDRNVKDGELIKLGYDVKYTLGWWMEDEESIKYMSKIRPFEYPLQQTPCHILNLPYKEIKPKIKLGYKRPIKEKYVCIATQATGKAKLWNYPNGWEEVVDYLKQQGYKVVDIDKEKEYGILADFKHFEKDKNIIPKNAIDDTGDKPLSRRVKYLEHCEFFIGLPSGLSWLAWASNCKTIMISGLSMDYTEFKPDVRIQNTDVCHGCWNKYPFSRDVWDWCPEFKFTPREFECTKTITPTMVIDGIKKVKSKK
jgi:autotransporter strand-loop-strand O-heptosyltransferase